jgi:hypothetical protein
MAEIQRDVNEIIDNPYCPEMPLGVQNDAAQIAYNTILRRVPTGPTSAARGVVEGPGNLAWTLQYVDGTPVVYLPSNLESLGDNKLAVLAVAAIRVLNADVRLSAEIMPVEPALDRKVQLYLSGVAWGLSRDNGSGELHPYQQVSGPMGHGFYWVAHTALQHRYKGSWWAQGHPWHLTKGMTGKSWSDTLTPMTRRVFSLVNAAAKNLRCSAWRTYFRTKESFLGKEVKRSLGHRRIGIITEQESAWLDETYVASIDAYNRLLNVLNDPTEEILSELSNMIKQVGSGLQSLEILTDKTISSRVREIYPSGKRERKEALKRPIEDLISEMDMDTYVSVFDPSLFRNKRRFEITIQPRDERDLHFWREQMRADYEGRVRSLRRSGYESLANLCSGWADNIFCPLPDQM